MIRRRIAGEVVGFFNDSAKGQQPIVPSDDALCPRGGVAWRVHGDVTAMMAGGIAALLLQMLHPRTLAGVWDHSDFKADMHGRLRNTARFIAVTTYGARADAEAAIARVRRIHDHVHGTLPDGSPYDANDPWLLSFVHLVGSMMFLKSWRRFGELEMSIADRDQYWREVAPVARMLGAERVPVTAAQAEELLREFLPELRANVRSRTVRDLIVGGQAGTAGGLPVQALLSRSAIDLLPPWGRQLHGVRASGFGGLPVGAATRTLASTLRWALAPR